MEELQVIETTSGRQFKPWASREDVQAIKQETVQAVGQAVQDPASITAVASEIASGKQAIASAINAKGGEASATESFTELAQAIQDTPTSGVLSGGIVQSEPFSFLDYVCKQGAYPFTEIDDDSVTVIDRVNAFYQQTQLLKVRMTALGAVSSGSTFQKCTALQDVNMPNLFTMGGSSAFDSCSALQNVTLPNLTTISGNGVFQNCSALHNVTLPNLTTISGYNTFAFCYALQNVTLPKLTFINQNNTFQHCSLLQSVIFGKMTTMNNPFTTDKPNLRNVTIGQNTDINLPFNYWTATNVIAEGQSGIAELNSNLYNNLLTKLYDHSNDGQTRTLRISWLANITAENIAYANAKGWTLTT